MATMGRRERKKAQTRQALADAAMQLFLERGYDKVTVAQVADTADVSIATLFAHVPDGKEALIFDDGSERREAIVAAVRDRPAGQPVLRALRDFLYGRGPFATDVPAAARPKLELILNTPALRDYQRKLWISAEAPLAEAIAAEVHRDRDDPVVRALARFVLETPELAGGEPDARGALDAIIGLLERGWEEATGEA